MVVLSGKQKDLGGFTVSRLIPQSEKRNVGPFVFLDHMGPFKVTASAKMDVRPHPHIGLATVTYLFKGSGWHRDNIGSNQIIRPGDINWMTAGSGIIHSERTPLEAVDGEEMEGLQIWVALPKEDENCEPSFFHHASKTLPEWSDDGNRFKLLIGSWRGQTSPVKTYSPTIYLEWKSDKGVSKQNVPFECEQVGIYPMSGEIKLNGISVSQNQIVILDKPFDQEWSVSPNAHLMIIGGEPHPEGRFMYWNFVHSDKEKIKEAAQWWLNSPPLNIEGEFDRIPLPDKNFAEVIDRLRS